MSARIHGLTAMSLVPSPDLFLARDKEGVTTATRSFSCLKSSANTPYIQAATRKGTSITALCSDVPATFADLTVETSSTQDQPGGISTVTIAFKGYISEGEFEFDREVTYSLRGVTQSKPIWQHPKFIKDFEDEDAMKSALVKICLGEAYAEGATAESNNWRVYQIPTDAPLFSAWVSTAGRDEWWKAIVVNGDREYDSPTYEWTRTTANAGGLSSVDLAPLGKEDNPPGDPPEPDGVDGWWRLADLSDERSEGQSNNSLTWRFVEGVPKYYERED